MKRMIFHLCQKGGLRIAVCALAIGMCCALALGSGGTSGTAGWVGQVAGFAFPSCRPASSALAMASACARVAWPTRLMRAWQGCQARRQKARKSSGVMAASVAGVVLAA